MNRRRLEIGRTYSLNVTNGADEHIAGSPFTVAVSPAASFGPRCEMVGEAQAQRLGDTAEPRTADRIARDSMRGCADKAQIEALIDGPWATAAVLEFGATVEID